MVESHLNPGNQKLEPGKTLAYGQSITMPASAGRTVKV